MRDPDYYEGIRELLYEELANEQDAYVSYDIGDYDLYERIDNG